MLTIASISVIITAALVKRSIDKKKKLAEQQKQMAKQEEHEEVAIHAS